MDNLLFKKSESTLEIKEADDGFVHLKGYAATFGNTDRVGDIIEAGAFAVSLTERMPKLLYQHRMSEPVGVIDRAYENDGGLIIEARMPKENSQVKDIYPLLKMGALGDFSIGFNVKRADMSDDGIRYIKEIELWEVSIVTIPANAQAKIMQVKHLEKENEDLRKSAGLTEKDDKIVDATKVDALDTKKDFEDMLKDTGAFTRKARVILASRFKEHKPQGDLEGKPEQSDSVDEEKLLDAINKCKQLLTKRD